MVQKNKKKYCLCVSGKLGSIVLNTLAEHKKSISCILTDSRSHEIIDLCDSVKIPCFKGNPRSHKAWEWLNEQKINFDCLLSINYLFILDSDVLGMADVAVNFHGSLLPKYRGRTPHVWAIINGEKQCGITAHMMNSKCDDGDIIKQLVVPIGEEDTGASILNKYNGLYPDFVLEITFLLEKGCIKSYPQDIKKATYYGKRTPDDGRINWDWQKERIRNWVRAQATPYPGAFTYRDGDKIIINKVMYSDMGYNDTDHNGMVLDVVNGCPIVKTQNGALIIKEFTSPIKIEKNNILI